MKDGRDAKAKQAWSCVATFARKKQDCKGRQASIKQGSFNCTWKGTLLKKPQALTEALSNVSSVMWGTAEVSNVCPANGGRRRRYNHCKGGVSSELPSYLWCFESTSTLKMKPNKKQTYQKTNRRTFLLSVFFMCFCRVLSPPPPPLSQATNCDTHPHILPSSPHTPHIHNIHKAHHNRMYKDIHITYWYLILWHGYSLRRYHIFA